MPYIYILQCQDNSLYTGIAVDIAKRMRQHCGKLAGGAKYTHSHPPKALVCIWETPDRTAAARFEFACKQLTRQQKENLIASPETWASFFPQLETYTYTPIPVQPLSDYLK